MKSVNLDFFKATKFIEVLPVLGCEENRPLFTQYIRVFGFPRKRSRIRQQPETSNFTARNEAAEWLLNEVTKVNFLERERNLILEIDGKFIIISALLHGQEKTP